MKRDPGLAQLSRDHHEALVMAQLLRRAVPETAGLARDAFLAFWDESGRVHFRLEEEVLFPAYSGHGDPEHPLIRRALADHTDIRRRVNDLAKDPRAPVAALRAIGACLADHVRMEERELFPLVEEAMPDDALAELADTLRRAENAAHAR